MSEILKVVGAAILRGEMCLVARRSDTMNLPGKWEFPGGKVEPGESEPEALCREIAEELGLTVTIGELLAVGRSQEDGRQIELSVYLATITGGVLDVREHADVQWAGAESLSELDWAAADLPAVRALLGYWSRPSSRG